MSFVRSYAFSVSRGIPNFTRSIVTGRQQQVACSREELNPLDTSVVARPGVQPFLRNKAIMLFVSQVAWRLNEALTSLVENAPVAVVYRRGVEKDI